MPGYPLVMMVGMRILVIGSGGREHALVKGLSADPQSTEIHAAPGSAAMSTLATVHPEYSQVDNADRMVELAQSIAADLVVIGPEVPLVAGVADALRAAGAEVEPEAFFDTLTVRVGVGQAGILAAAEQRGINLRRVGRDRVGISVDETTDAGVIARVLDAFGITDPAEPATSPAIPEALLRDSDFMTHPVFHMNRAESEMMRYMRRLSDRDLALDRAMIPLGSCTMKLNAAAEMMPLTWPEFGALHPFALGADGQTVFAKDINDAMAELPGRARRAVLIVPLGFVSDHMEVLWDLDTEALETAQELGLTAIRTPTPGTHPAYVAGLVDLVAERLAGTAPEDRPHETALGPWYDVCRPGCCENKRLGFQPALAGVAP